jgi:PTS system mannose-specific IIA component
MSIGILVITHDRVGRSLVDTATATLGFCPLDTGVIEVAPDCDPDALLARAQRAAQRLDQGDGVLVLTDVYGSTPSNIACSLLKAEHVRVVAGVNLPMLLRVFNYALLSLDELGEKALSGGRDGIVNCTAAGAKGLRRTA